MTAGGKQAAPPLQFSGVPALFASHPVAHLRSGFASETGDASRSTGNEGRAHYRDCQLNSSQSYHDIARGRNRRTLHLTLSGVVSSGDGRR
jgi:hypothetical protein